MQKNFRGLTLTLVALMLALSLQLYAQQRTRERKGAIPPPTKSTNKLQEMANKAGGRFVLRYQPNATVYPNLEELAKRSDVIVVGRTLGHRTRLSEDGNQIYQEFLVRVQEVLKGDSPGRSLVMTIPGGAYTFDDGTTAIVEPLGQPRPEEQGFYVFFLNSPETEGRGLTLASETQGFFGLGGETVEPANRGGNNPMVAKYGDMSAADFLGELHRAVPRKQGTRK